MTTAMICLCLALIFFWLALHPFTTYPLSLALLARLVRASGRASSTSQAGAPSFSILTCAYNEEASIASKVRNMLSLQASRKDVQLLVYVDGSTDRTAEIARTFPLGDALHASTERRGKTAGMNLLVGKAKGEILVFTDANVILADDVLDRLAEHFTDPDVGCVCGNLVYVNSDESTTAAQGSLYWRLEERIKRLETLTGSAIGADGSLFAIRRELHSPPPPDIIDDFHLALQVLCAGRRVIQSGVATAYEKSVPSTREEFARKIRIACQAFNVHRSMAKALRSLDALHRYKYVSHKLMRWFGIYFIFAGLVCLVGACIALQAYVAAALMAALPAVTLFLGLRLRVPVFKQIAELLTAFGGAGLGVYRSLKGDRFTTWAPAVSLRK